MRNNLRNLFLFKDLDSHYVINLLGVRLRIKHKNKVKYQEATEYGLTTETRTPRLIVSLTTHPGRINTVHLAVNTLLRQTLKPDKIILWLANEQFPRGEEELPQELLRLKELGLTIGWCEDLKSYKKLIPTLREYPNDIIVTVDDDVYYDNDLLNNLYNAYLKDNSNIYVRRSVKIELKDNELCGISSGKYGYESIYEPTYLNQLMGGSGCLYPPNSLYKDVLNIDKIKTTIPTHDDAYFWCMAILNRTKIQVVDGFKVDLNFIPNTQECGLIRTNKTGQSGISLEDAYKVMIKEYPEILEIVGHMS